jgi:Tfp pilus assembly protein PilV
MTLVEVLVTVVVLSIGILGLAPMFALSIESNGRANDTTTATEQAQTTLEGYRKLATLPPAPFTQTTTDSTTGLTQAVYVDDSQSDGSLAPGISRVRVRINWTDARNVARVIEYSCLRTAE